MHRAAHLCCRRRLIAALALVPAVVGCSSSSSPSATTSGAASTSATVTTSGSPPWTPVTPTTTGPARGAALELTAARVGPVAVGSEGRAAEAALIELLGRPDRTTDGPGCALFTPVPRERALFWADFHVLLTASTSADPELTLTGWSLGGRSTPVPAHLPHGITLGTSNGDDVRRADPKAEEGSSLGAGIVLAGTDGVQYILSGETTRSPVVQVVYGISACE